MFIRCRWMFALYVCQSLARQSLTSQKYGPLNIYQHQEEEEDDGGTPEAAQAPDPLKLSWIPVDRFQTINNQQQPAAESLDWHNFHYKSSGIGFCVCSSFRSRPRRSHFWHFSFFCPLSRRPRTSTFPFGTCNIWTAQQGPKMDRARKNKKKKWKNESNTNVASLLCCWLIWTEKVVRGRSNQFTTRRRSWTWFSLLLFTITR